VLRVMDEEHGALATRERWQHELSCIPPSASAQHADFLAQLFEYKDTFEWHREDHLRRAVLAHTVERLLDEGGHLRESRQAPAPASAKSTPSSRAGARSTVRISRRQLMRSQLMKQGSRRDLDATERSAAGPTLAGSRQVYVSPIYQDVPSSDGQNLFDELTTRFQAAGVEVSDTLAPHRAAVVLLAPSVFNSGLVQEWSDLISSDAASAVRLLPLASTAVPFSMLVASCPPSLQSLVTAFKYHKWPHGQLLQVAAAGHAIERTELASAASVTTQLPGKKPRGIMRGRMSRALDAGCTSARFSMSRRCTFATSHRLSAVSQGDEGGDSAHRPTRLDDMQQLDRPRQADSPATGGAIFGHHTGRRFMNEVLIGAPLVTPVAEADDDSTADTVHVLPQPRRASLANEPREATRRSAQI